MKFPVLLLALLFAASPAAWAQSASPAPSPNYFGKIIPSTADAAAPAADEAKVPVNPATTSASESATMKKVADLLKTAQGKLQSTTSTTPKADALPLAEAARDALRQTTGNGYYHGHRTKAQNSLRDFVTELKAGDKENKAAANLTDALAEVVICQSLVK